MKLKSLLLLSVISVFISCKLENKERTSKSESVKEEISLKNKIENKNIKLLEEKLNNKLNKAIVNIELTNKISKRKLKKIAKKIRKYENKNIYKNLWIFYFIRGTKENSGAWATSHYSPNLEVKILGSTEKEEKVIKEKTNSIKEDIIGKWYEEQYTSSSFILYKSNGEIIGKTIFKNGQEMKETLESEKVKLGIKYFDKDNGQGEYYIILKDGKLGYFNKENKQYTTGVIME